MKQTVVICGIVCLCIVTWGCLSFRSKGILEKQVGQMRLQLEVSAAESKAQDETVAEFQTKLEQITEVLTNVIAQRSQAEAEADNFKNKLQDLQMSQPQKEDYAKLVAEVPTNEVWSKTGKVLLENADFVQLQGRRLVFKTGPGVFDNFDVDDVHPGVLARYHIDVDKAKAEQERIDQNQAAWAARSAQEKQRIAQARAAEAAEQARISAEAAKEEAAAERQQFEDDLRATASYNDSVRSAAAMKNADAAMYQTLYPPPVTFQRFQ